MNRTIYKSKEETEILIKFFDGQIVKCEKLGDDRGAFINEQQKEDCEMWLVLLKGRENETLTRSL